MESSRACRCELALSRFRSKSTKSEVIEVKDRWLPDHRAVNERDRLPSPVGDEDMPSSRLLKPRDRKGGRVGSAGEDDSGSFVSGGSLLKRRRRSLLGDGDMVECSSG